MFETLKNRVETKDCMAVMLGITVLEADRGYGKVSMPLTDNVRNPVGAPHGGAIFSLADIAFGVAANYGQEKVMITTSSSISFIKQAKSGPVIAEARLVNGGKRMSTFDVKLYDGENTLIASALMIGYRIDVSIA